MKVLLDFSLKFLKLIWKFLIFLRQFINVLSGFIFILFLVGFFYFFVSQKKNIDSYNGALLIDLKGRIVDQVYSNSSFDRNYLGRLFFLKKKKEEISLFEIVENIRKSILDNKITGIVLKLDNLLDSDQTSLEYIGKVLMEFKNSGKMVYSVGDSYTQSQYYLASFSSKIYMSPHGSVDIHGLSSNRFYYKEFLDNIKIKRHIFRIGKYKSAIEPLIRNNMSKESRQSDYLIINTLWDNYLSTISKNRNIGYKNIFPGSHGLINKLKIFNGDSAEYAKNQNIVDDLFNEIDIEKKLISIFGKNKNNNSFNYINITDYKNIKLKYKKEKYSYTKPNIAVIVVQGVMNWKDENGFIGDQSIVKKIRQAKLNKNIKCVILRINSPGGSVYAAEKIRDELIDLRNHGKSIVVSMGSVAASAGYWISTPADYIISNPITITGSIGIFGFINTLEDTLSNIGIKTDGVSTTFLSDISLTKGLNKEFYDLMKINIEHGYRKFIKYVSSSRHKNFQEIDRIAQGKIWIGSDAFKNGLVDSLGDFDLAVDKAAELCDIKIPIIDWMKEKNSFFENLFLEFFSYFSLNKLDFFFSEKYFFNLDKNIYLFDKIYDPKHEYAFCLNCINFY